MKVTSEFKKQIITFVLGGFGLVAGLAWNDAIRSLIEFLYPLQQNSLPAKFIYAGLITVVLVIASTVISQLNTEKPDKKPYR